MSSSFLFYCIVETFGTRVLQINLITKVNKRVDRGLSIVRCTLVSIFMGELSSFVWSKFNNLLCWHQQIFYGCAHSGVRALSDDRNFEYLFTKAKEPMIRLFSCLCILLIYWRFYFVLVSARQVYGRLGAQSCNTHCYEAEAIRKAQAPRRADVLSNQRVCIIWSVQLAQGASGAVGAAQGTRS
jgi:hypothetical protein